ncbi:hypothetical protein BDW62DRAFT_176268 [Aspergillus aurantiobrunneus]
MQYFKGYAAPSPDCNIIWVGRGVRITVAVLWAAVVAAKSACPWEMVIRPQTVKNIQGRWEVINHEGGQQMGWEGSWEAMTRLDDGNIRALKGWPAASE